MNRRRNTSRRSFGGRKFRPANNRNRKSNIDITSFIEKAKQNNSGETIDLTVDRSFTDFRLNKHLQSNIDKIGFTKPTPIQDRVFDQVLEGQDVLGIANTGTGKTGAFLIPIIQRMHENPQTKVLIIAPTRELALQINTEFFNLVKGSQFYSVQCIGGTNMGQQIRKLTRNYHAIIGTPGRILDLAEREYLNLNEFNVVVLDEVDRMLDMGFVNDIRKVLSKTPSEKQSLYFSATISTRVARLIQEFSEYTYDVSVKTNETTDMVEQDIVKYQYEDKKLDVLHDLLKADDVNKVIIFGRTKHGVKKLMFKLQDRGFKAESIHGNKSQSQRQRALRAFKENHVTILVATDVAARGLDIDDVSHVINYDIPQTYDDYVHRIGRTGRAGKKGVAYTLVR